MLSSLIVAFLEKDIVLHFSSSPRASLFFFFFFKSFFSFFLFFLFSHIHKLFFYILLKLFLVVSFSVFSVIFSFFFFSISCRFILFCFVYLSSAHSWNAGWWQVHMSFHFKSFRFYGLSFILFHFLKYFSNGLFIKVDNLPFFTALFWFLLLLWFLRYCVLLIFCILFKCLIFPLKFLLESFLLPSSTSFFFITVINSYIFTFLFTSYSSKTSFFFKFSLILMLSYFFIAFMYVWFILMLLSFFAAI